MIMLYKIREREKNDNSGKLCCIVRTLLLLTMIGILSGCGKKTLSNGAGEEIFRDLAEGAEQVQEWSETIHSGMLTLDLGGVQEVQCLRIRWDRSVSSGVSSWTIVGWQEELAKIYPSKSSGEGALVLYQSDQTPYLAEETICLPTAVPVRTLRIMAEGVNTVPEVSVYAQDPWKQVFDSLHPRFENGKLVTDKVPDWLQVKYASCRPSAILDQDGGIAGLLEEKEVHVGFTASYGDWTMESPDYTLRAPAAQTTAEQTTAAANPRPMVLPELQEWQGGEGTLSLTEDTIIFTDAEYSGIASVFAEDAKELFGQEWEVRTEGTPQNGDVVFRKCTEESLGTEGYRIELGDTVTVTALSEQGLYWGSRTLLQMMLSAEPEDEGSAQTDGPYRITSDGLVSGGIQTARMPRENLVLPKGRIRDYPAYPVRGFEIDVARNSVSLHMLREMVKTLSWYKCNELSVHLNDNAILAYTEKRDSWDTVYTIYSAYRLESTLQGSNGQKLTASDMFYSKTDFTSFVRDAASMGVRVIPEIDTPAHSLAITKAFPEAGIASKGEADMLDLAKEDSVQLVKEIWTDALPAFENCPVVHIGGDEYYGDAGDYIRFENTMLDFLTQQEKSIRMWGSLSQIRGSGYVTPRDNLELLIWNTDWADPEVMYREGFSLINAWNKQLYLIPGGGYDYIDGEQLYTLFAPNCFYTEDESECMELPLYSDRIRGAQICMWNDLCDELAIGITEYDMFDRLYQALPSYAAKCWNIRSDMSYEALREQAQSMGLAPDSNPYDELLALQRWKYPLEGKTGEGKELLGPPYEILIQLEDITKEETPGRCITLGDTERDGNRYILYLRNANGKVGIACEEYEYEWDYVAPVNETVNLLFKGEKDCITLYVNGQSVGSIGSAEPFAEHATFLFPREKILGLFNPTRSAWPPAIMKEDGEILIHKFYSDQGSWGWGQ